MAGGFEQGMRRDINRILDHGGSNDSLYSQLSELMIYKYSGLETFCLVYNDLAGFNNHCFNGSRVESLHRNGKCGIVFYRTKGQPAMFSGRYGEAHRIVSDAGSCGKADECYNKIITDISVRGIGWTGCAVIKRYTDLKFGGNVSTSIANVVGPNFTAILLLQ